MKKLFTRVLCCVLCLCLLPMAALAQSPDDYPVSHSDFELSFHLNADGFPNDGAAHYQDWETFLDKISIRGEADIRRFLHPLSRTYVNAAIFLNGKSVVPFEYDNYYSDFRYLRSAALGGASVFFHFRNFLQFMLKGYYYMGLPTQLAALPMYPQGTFEFIEKYKLIFDEAFAGEGSREMSYDDLYALCEQLNLIMTEDKYDASYYLLTCYLIDIGADGLVWDKLAYTENWLDHLDPEQGGMTISVDGENESWVIGETTVFEKVVDGEQTQLLVTLPDPDGYVFTFRLVMGGGEYDAQFVAELEGEERLNVHVTADGLADLCNVDSTLRVEIGGAAVYQPIPPQTFRCRYTRTAEAVPFDVTMTLDWLHPETGLPAFGLDFAAALTGSTADAIFDRPYDNKEDLFHLNESFLEELKQRFIPTLALSALPFLMEMPAGIISDAVGFLEQTGLLAVLGLE